MNRTLPARGFGEAGPSLSQRESGAQPWPAKWLPAKWLPAQWLIGAGRAALALLTLGLLAGCTIDPFDRPGVWRPGGVNDANLAVMAADPNDLVRGHGEAGADGQLATAPVTRLREDRVKPLPALDATPFSPGSNGTGGGDSGGAPPPAAPPPAAPAAGAGY